MADAAGIGLKLRPQGCRAREAGRRMEGRFAREGKAGLHLRPIAALVGKRKTEHDGFFGNRPRKNFVIVRQPLKERGLDPDDIAHDRAWRKAVGFREEDVECDRRRSRFGEPVHQLGHAVPRPWPLAEFLQRRFVYVDHADRQILECPRRDALILVERHLAGQPHELRVAGPQDREDRDDYQTDNDANLLRACHSYAIRPSAQEPSTTRADGENRARGVFPRPCAEGWSKRPGGVFSSASVALPSQPSPQGGGVARRIRPPYASIHARKGRRGLSKSQVGRGAESCLVEIE